MMNPFRYAAPAAALLLSFFVGIILHAQTRPEPVEKPALLWKIEGQGLATPSYLLGTIHILGEKDFFFSTAMQRAFDASEQVVLELDMDDPALATQMMTLAEMPEGENLQNLLSPRDYAKLDSMVKKSLGVGVDFFRRWQPLLISSIFIKEYLDSPPSSYEETLVKMAQKAQKPILGLETVQEQIQAMASIPFTKQASFLSELLNEPVKQKALFQKMVELYRAQEIHQLLQYMVEQSGGVDFTTVLINQRNRNWIDRIAAKAREKSTFFGVGAGHLGGEQGVVALLRAAGYQLTPLR